MTCPNCGSAEISPLTNRCELCGFVPEGAVAVEAAQLETVDEFAHQELAELFSLRVALGRTPTTVVYLAREADSDRDLVVKALVRPGELRAQADDRFVHAVEAVAALEHPHIVPVFDHGSTEHLYWYSMEHVRGRSLREYLRVHGPMELKACQRVVTQVASALDHAHRRGIVHGALKPENVLIDAEGWVHVCDLLVTLALRPSAPPVFPGAMTTAVPPAEDAPKTPRSPYVSPEQLCTPFSDQYALAALVYECLAGSPLPASGGAADAAPALLVPGRSDVPAYMMRAVERALSPKPMDRFPGVLDFVAALETHSLSAPDVRVPARASGTVLVQTDWEPPARQINWRLIVGTATVLAAAAALAFPLRPAALQLLHRVAGWTAPAPPAALISDSVARGAPPSDTASPVAAGPVAPPPPAREVRQRGTRSTRTAVSPSRREPTNAAAPAVATRAAPAPAADSGRLFVNATPWGQLYVDGQLVGNTPKANLSLAAGAHTIRVVRDGFEPFERSIQIAPGQVVRLTDIALAARRP